MNHPFLSCEVKHSFRYIESLIQQLLKSHSLVEDSLSRAATKNDIKREIKRILMSPEIMILLKQYYNFQTENPFLIVIKETPVQHGGCRGLYDPRRFRFVF